MKLPRLVKQIGKRVVQAMPILRRHILTSTDYEVLGGVEQAREAQASSPGWLASRTVARQERAYRNLIAAMKRGEPRLDFKVAAEAVAATGIAKPSLIEIGCGSGHYSDVFATLLRGGVTYTGIDYSAVMIERAHAQYPTVQFEVADATRLPYADARFDIAFNGVSLMHIVDYAAAIREDDARGLALLHPAHRAGVRRLPDDLLAQIRLWRRRRGNRVRPYRVVVALRAVRPASRADMAMHSLRRLAYHRPSLDDRDLAVLEALSLTTARRSSSRTDSSHCRSAPVA